MHSQIIWTCIALKDDPNITSYAKDYAYLRFMLFKQDEPWMNRDVRQALMHAIDRPAIVESSSETKPKQWKQMLLQVIGLIQI